MADGLCYPGMLQDLLDLEEGLSDWEVDFIEDLSKQQRDLTDKQKAKLKEIWEAKVGD